MPKTKTEKLQERLETLRKAEKNPKPKNITKEEFTRYVRPCGSSGHIGVSKAWVNKLVKVNIEEVTD